MFIICSEKFHSVFLLFVFFFSGSVVGGIGGGIGGVVVGGCGVGVVGVGCSPVCSLVCTHQGIKFFSLSQNNFNLNSSIKQKGSYLHHSSQNN